MKLELTILAENNSYKTPHSENGFCAFIDINDKKYLFDVGLSGVCAIKNAEYLGIDLKGIEGVILSHGHDDHLGGLIPILEYTGVKKVYAHPDIFCSRYSLKNGREYFAGASFLREDLEKEFEVKFTLKEHLFKIEENIHMTGVIPFTNGMEKISDHFKIKNGGELEADLFADDNSLVVETPKGLVVVLGCAHRGVVNILSYVENVFKRNVYAVIGGMHLHQVSALHFDYVIDFFKKSNLQLIAPGHCTGGVQIDKMRESFKEKVIPAFCGQRFQLF